MDANSSSDGRSDRKGPEIVIIAAVADRNRVIGNGLSLPWHIPEDLKRFKRLTHGHPMIMGRVTFESIIAQFGGPLPGRRHLVLTRRPEGVSHPAAESFSNLAEALEAVKDEDTVFIVGGAAVYASTIESADRLELTIVDGAYNGDAFFPPWRHLVGSVYRLQSREEKDGFRYETYIRKEYLTLT